MEYIYISDELLNISTTVNTEKIIVTTVPVTESKISETVTVTVSAETTLNNYTIKLPNIKLRRLSFLSQEH